MKILIIISTLDLRKPFGATPAIWQLLKGFYEDGNEIVVIPYSGSEIDSLWWRSYSNPNYYKGELLEFLLRHSRISTKARNSSIIPSLAKIFVRPALEKMISRVLDSENNIDALLFIGIPFNQLSGLPKRIRKNYNIPVIFYDLDVPTSLPSHGGFTFNYFQNARLDDYDCLIIPSEGSVSELKELGANEVFVVHFGVDPSVYIPFELPKNVDVFFFGNGGSSRANNIKMMITDPSRKLDYKFRVSGRNLDLDLGRAETVGPLYFSQWIKHARKSKINLNVARELHANVFATSSSRPFELGALKSCIVSSPYKGLEKWFEIGKELFMISSTQDCIEVYQSLLENEDLRLKTGQAAYERVIKEHTSVHRAKEVIRIINKYI